MCLLLIAFWASNVAVVTDPNNGLAVDENGAVSNGNLYYFSWAGLICSVILATSFLRGVYHLDLAGEIRQRAARLNYWSAMVVCCFVVMGASANVRDTYCNAEESTYCKRTIFGISLGAICAILALYVVVMKIVTRRTFFVVEAIFSGCMVVAWAFGVALLTAEAGPGAPLGNLYYFTWASFFIAFILCSSLYDEYQSFKNPPREEAAANDNDRDVEVENVQNLEDEI